MLTFTSEKPIKTARAFYAWVLLIIIFSPLPALSQKEANNWILGPNTGITFRYGVPQKLTPTSGNSSHIRSAISDADGNLLFYSNGIKVWDRNHKEMPNGKDLKGTSYTNCQIIPKPGDPNRYFIFTTMGNGWGAPFEAAYYSEIDLCLNNGLGDVMQQSKNTRLMSIAGVRSAAVRHSNGIDYWVAFHKWNADTFYCYLVTSEGISMSPVISRTGSYLTFTSNSTGDGGEMKFSPDGKRLALAISQSGTAEVFDFNSQTGVLSNPLHIPPMYRQNHQAPDYTQGIEFSPDGRKLYLSRTIGCLLLQYDLSAGDKKAVLKSRTILAGDTLQHNTFDFYYIHGLQLGPDGKVYVANYGNTYAGISVISKPNEKGLACLYKNNIITWENKEVPFFYYSFPTFVASYFDATTSIRNEFDCLSASVQFSLSYPKAKSGDDIEKIHWHFDDNASGASNESEEVNPLHTFISAGTHTVRAKIQWSDGATQELKQMLTIPPDVVNGKRFGLGNDTTLCPGATLRLDASHAGGDIIWQDGSKKDYFDVTSPGVYWVRICKPGCSITDSVTVTAADIPGFLGRDITLCEKKEIVLDVKSIGEVIGWQDNSTSPTYTIKKPGTYWVKIRRSNCVITDSMVVKFCDKAISIPNIITPNGDKLNDHFDILGIENDVWSLTIHNRYGKEVYHTNSYKNDWAGSDLPNGTYYYYLRHNGLTKFFKGWVEIRR